MFHRILDKREGSIRFEVDLVTPADTPLETAPQRAIWERHLDTPVLHASSETPLVSSQGCNPLVHAVHLAFSDHRPLVLSPDAIWLTIAQGFVHHINANAEALRGRFVRHKEGEVRLEIGMDDLSAASWDQGIEAWSAQLAEHVGPGVKRMIECDFTTTTPESLTASRVVMMDTYKAYFDFVINCVCGIPEVTLLGTPEDWEKIIGRVHVLAEYDLSWWTDRLLPICEKLLQTARGDVPFGFWSRIYKPKEAYGGDVVTGWVAYLFPYLERNDTKAPTRRNPILARNPRKVRVHDGVMNRRFPTGVAQAPITVRAEGRALDLDILGGLIGVEQDPDTLALQPHIGWGVRESSGFGPLLARLSREHELGPPVDINATRLHGGTTAAQLELIHHFDGGVLYNNTPNPWRVRPYRACKTWSDYETNESYCQLIDLADGRSVVVMTTSTRPDTSMPLDELLRVRHYEETMIVCRLETTSSEHDHVDPSYLLQDVRVVARSLQELFEGIEANQGRYFFDAPGFSA